MIALEEAEGISILLDFLAECGCILLGHPSTQNVEGVIVVRCAGCEFADIKVRGIHREAMFRRGEIFLMGIQNLVDLLFETAKLFISVCKLFFKAVCCVDRCALVLIREEETLKMQGSIDRVDLLVNGVRHKIDQPDILGILLTLVNDGVDRVVGVSHEFFVILVCHASETEADILEIQNITDFIVQICKRNDVGDRCLNSVLLFDQSIPLCRELFQLLIEVVYNSYSFLDCDLLFRGCRKRFMKHRSKFYGSLKFSLVWVTFHIWSQS